MKYEAPDMRIVRYETEEAVIVASVVTTTTSDPYEPPEMEMY